MRRRKARRRIAARRPKPVVSGRHRCAIGPGDDAEGTEVTSNAVLGWTREAGIASHVVAPGRPMQNGLCEASNVPLRDELLNETLLFGLEHARVAACRRVADRIHSRPHSALGFAAPAVCAAQLAATGNRLRKTEALRRLNRAGIPGGGLL